MCIRNSAITFNTLGFGAENKRDEGTKGKMILFIESFFYIVLNDVTILPIKHIHLDHQ